jgi:uncharacterized membrane protein
MPTRSRVAATDAPGLEAAVEEDIREIRDWERANLAARSPAEQLSDWIATTIASGPSILIHLAWFVAWMVVNAGLLPRLVFDAFPFPLLTMVVSLEAIFLALFVLASQNRLSRQADKRTHLDLQIDLLAEREMTAVLQLLDDIAAHFKIQTSVKASEIRDLARKTDLHGLTRRMEELAESPPATPSPEPSRHPPG